MTTAITPNLASHEGLSPHASRLVDPASMPWQPTRYPGIEVKTLLFDRSKGLLTAMMRFAPGAVLPDHEHVQIEQTYVVEGHLLDKEGPEQGIECKAGQFIWRPAGSRHAAWSPNGAITLASFQIPNKFFDADGAAKDMTGQDWEEVWGALHAG